MNQPEAFFLQTDTPSRGQRLCLFHPAQGALLRGRVVYVHPFAEEMNKSRRMAATQARAMAAAGFSVLQIDLLGCGDSSGDFGDASWQDWIEDVLRACNWIGARDAAHAAAPLWLWGLRAGCLLAAAAAARLEEPCNFCFWQPITSGRQQMQQFMRLRLAADLLAGNSKGMMEAMRQQLANGDTLEIAGYRLAADLALGLEQAHLLPPAPARPGRLAWFEVSTALPDNSPSPVSAQAIARWAESGYRCDRHPVQGPAFWQTTEIEDAPALIAATMAALLSGIGLTADQSGLSEAVAS